LGILLRCSWRVNLMRFRLLPPELFWFRINDPGNTTANKF
jgi:hypothetical protein